MDRLKSAKYRPGEKSSPLIGAAAAVDGYNNNNNNNNNPIGSAAAARSPPKGLQVVAAAAVGVNQPPLEQQHLTQWAWYGSGHKSAAAKTRTKARLTQADLQAQSGGGGGGELAVLRLVELGALACGAGELRAALERAREALEAFKRLKAARAQLERRRRQGDSASKRPMTATTTVGLFELGIMVNSFLASRLASSGQPREALELYTQLCRLAGSSSNVVGSLDLVQQAPMVDLGSLYRFGLNIGNLHLELGEHQRALKYYRLTLDRLSSLGLDNLRMKLMHNIALSHLSLGQWDEARAALELLVADNVAGGRCCINSRHHQFGLHLMVCQFQRNDLNGLLATLKSLVAVNICHHYEESRPIGAKSRELGVGRQDPNRRAEGAASDIVNKSQGDSGRSDRMMNGGDDDRLERLIGARLAEISRALIMGCNLILHLDGQQHNRRLPATGPTPNQARTSVSELCMKLLDSSDTYKALGSDLRANSAARLLAGRSYKLDEAVRALEAASSNHNSMRDGESDCISSAAATNQCLLNLLQHNTKRALEVGQQALELDEASREILVNLANCHLELEELGEAERLLQRAHSLEPTCWTTNYNLALLHRRQLAAASNKLNQRQAGGSQKLKPATMASLTRDHDLWPPLLSGRNMILSLIQLALIHKQSGEQQQASAILSALLNDSKQAPEVHLLASELAAVDDKSGGGVGAQRPMSILQQANKDYPYHLPVAERLIALQIQNFNYDAANKLILGCIKNRPDQVKWFQMLAECHRRATNYNKAIAVYKTAVDTFPQDTSCLKALVKLFDELGMQTEESKFYVTKLNKLLG